MVANHHSDFHQQQMQKLKRGHVCIFFDAEVYDTLWKGLFIKCDLMKAAGRNII